MILQSFRFKISMLYSSILAIMLFVYSAIFYFSLYPTVKNEIDRDLKIKTQEIKDTINNYAALIGPMDPDPLQFCARRAVAFTGKHAKRKKIKDAEDKWFQKFDALDLREDFIHIATAQGKSFAYSPNCKDEVRRLFLSDLTIDPATDMAFRTGTIDKKTVRIIQVRFYYQNKPEYIIQIAAYEKPFLHLLQKRLFWIEVSIPIFLVIASFSGLLFAARILKPVADITAMARKITYEDLSARVRTRHHDEEMRRLVEAFNDMIARLEGSFKHIGEFSSQVAHELKTPLAILRGESELALRKEREPEEYKRALTVILEETGRMLKIVEDLLLLTRLDYSPEIFKFVRIDVVKFLTELYEQTKLLAQTKEIKVALDVPDRMIFMNGDAVHLRRLFFNIIHNAIKFTPRGGEVSLRLRQNSDMVTIEVSDSGIGILEKDIPKIFDRFFHGSRSGFQVEPGNGLGLSISLAIAKFHHGNISVKSIPNQGSTFSISLPVSF